jgi:hypothetical protein
VHLTGELLTYYTVASFFVIKEGSNKTGTVYGTVPAHCYVGGSRLRVPGYSQ